MLTRPIARVVGLSTDGQRVHQVRVRCGFCGGVHQHEWFGDEGEAVRSPTCGAIASYTISIGVKERVESMLAQSPGDALALAPLYVSYCYQRDGEEDLVGITLHTSIGALLAWLPLETALQMAGHLVTIADRRDQLREAYAARQGLPA